MTLFSSIQVDVNHPWGPLISYCLRHIPCEKRPPIHKITIISQLMRLEEMSCQCDKYSNCILSYISPESIASMGHGLVHRQFQLALYWLLLTLCLNKLLILPLHSTSQLIPLSPVGGTTMQMNCFGIGTNRVGWMGFPPIFLILLSVCSGPLHKFVLLWQNRQCLFTWLLGFLRSDERVSN
jgi:hypothetical protein